MSSPDPKESPVAIGLMLCDQVIVDKDTNKPSPVGIFTGLAIDDFDEAQRFSAFAVLTNGQGLCELQLAAYRLDTDHEIYRQVYNLWFPDPLAVVNVNIRIRQLRFPDTGWYDFALLANGELVGQRRIRVYKSH